MNMRVVMMSLVLSIGLVLTSTMAFAQKMDAEKMKEEEQKQQQEEQQQADQKMKEDKKVFVAEPIKAKEPQITKETENKNLYMEQKIKAQEPVVTSEEQNMYMDQKIKAPDIDSEFFEPQESPVDSVPVQAPGLDPKVLGETPSIEIKAPEFDPKDIEEEKTPLEVKAPEIDSEYFEPQESPVDSKPVQAAKFDVNEVKTIDEAKKIASELTMDTQKVIEEINNADTLANQLVNEEIIKVQAAEKNVLDAKAEEITATEKVINKHYQELEKKSDLAVQTNEALAGAEDIKKKIEEQNQTIATAKDLEQAKQELESIVNTSKKLNDDANNVINEVKKLGDELRAKDPIGDEDNDKIINLMDAEPYKPDKPEILEEAKNMKDEENAKSEEIATVQAQDNLQRAQLLAEPVRVQTTENDLVSIQEGQLIETEQEVVVEETPLEEDREKETSPVRVRNNLDVLEAIVNLRMQEEEKIKEEIAKQENKKPEDVKPAEIAVAREIDKELVRLEINPTRDIDEDTIPDREDECEAVAGMSMEDLANQPLTHVPDQGCPPEGLEVQDIDDIRHWTDVVIPDEEETEIEEETLVLTPEGEVAIEEEKLAKEQAPGYQASIDQAALPATDVEDVEVGEGPWAMRGAGCSLQVNTNLANISYLWTVLMLLPIIIKRRRQ